MNKRLIYALLTILLVAVEVFIALFVHDNFVRPYLGDVIVVIVIYTFIRIFIPEGVRLLPLYIFIFATVIEVLQYFDYVKLLGLSNSRFFRTLLGTSFSFIDIICYAAGCLILAGFEVFLYIRKKHAEKSKKT